MKKRIVIIITALLLLATAVAYAATEKEITDTILYSIDETSGIEVIKLNDALVLKGTVNSLDKRNTAENVAHIYSPTVMNYIQVGSAEQIRLEVMMVEIDREKVADLGIDWGSLGPNGFKSGAAFIGQGVVNGASAAVIGGNLALGYASIQAKIRALVDSGDAKIISRPAVLTSNAATAWVRVGGTLPIPKGVNQNYSIDWKDYGIKLVMTPKLNVSGTITADVAAEVIDIDPLSLANSVTISSENQTVTIPTFKANNVNANLTLKPGDTLAMGGMLAYSISSDDEGVIGLEKIPLLGSLFKQNAKRNMSVEMLIFVTPTIVKAANVPDKNSTSPGMQKMLGVDLYKKNVDVLEK